MWHEQGEKGCGYSTYQKYLLHHLFGQDPRTVIIADNGQDMVLLPQFSSEDIITVLWHIPDLSCPSGPGNKGKDFIICSLYWDYLHKDLPKQFKELLKYGETSKIPLIITGDTNAHSELWGCINSNKRGETMENELLQYKIDIINEGSHPTFENR